MRVDMSHRAARFASILVLLGAAACAERSQPAAAPAAPAATPHAAKPDPRAAAHAIVDAPDRSEADRALDLGRHPVEMLELLALAPGMKVADLGAGPGYTTELLVRAVGPTGTVFMHNEPTWLPCG